MFVKFCRLGNDPELRFTQGGSAVLNLNLAYSYGQKGADGKRETQWLEASLWGKQAEGLAPHLKKGDGVVVSVDDLHIETYSRTNGMGQGYKLVGRIIALDFAGKKEGERQADHAPARAPAPAASAVPGGGFDNFDDDIPF